MTTIQGEISQAARQQANRISAAEALDRAVDLVSQKRGLGLNQSVSTYGTLTTLTSEVASKPEVVLLIATN
jgi:hypothetical protein